MATVTQVNEGTAEYPEANAGFALRITYDKAMNMGTYPTVAFTSSTTDLSGTLIYNAAQSWWINNMTYFAAYDVHVVGSGVSASDVVVHVAGAFDAAGDIQAQYTHDAPFTVDTTTAAPLAHVLSVTPNVSTVTGANVGSHTFYLTIVYNMAMNTNCNPTVTLTSTDPSGVSATLTYQAAWSSWTNSTTFVVRFDVADANVAVSGIGVTVTGAFDYEVGARGNLQDPGVFIDIFSIDTLS